MENSALPRSFFIGLAASVLVPFAVFFWRFGIPNAFYWDENYHVASAQRYLNGVFFMEPHPPFGKLLIAAGELLFDENETIDACIGQDHCKDPGKGYSLRGARFFSTLTGALVPAALFLVLFVLTGSTGCALASALLASLDNAMVVHNRGAMLEGPLLCLIAWFIAGTVWIAERRPRGARLAFAAASLGVLLGLIATTKYTGLIVALLLGAIVWRYRRMPRALLGGALVGALATSVTVFAVWETHFALGGRVIETLSDKGWYHASPELKEVVTRGEQGAPSNFPLALRDALAFVSSYSRGVPALDLCKSDENGSSPWLWPFGARSISYRWERTPDGLVSYVYLQANPVVWALGLLGIFLCAALLAASTMGMGAPVPRHAFWMAAILLLYAVYMIVVGTITRVMYLYHYFPPLIFSIILFGLASDNLWRIGRVRLADTARSLAYAGLVLVAAAGFRAYSPFTYFYPIANEDVEARRLLNIWGLRCTDCPMPPKL